MNINVNGIRSAHIARRAAAIRGLAEKGCTRKQISEELGISISTIWKFAKIFDIAFAREKTVRRTTSFQFSEGGFRELLHYEPGTGEFIWRRHVSGTARVGDRAGSPDVKGYTMIRIGAKRYRAHRLAWLYMYGTLPSQQIDHIDGDKANNRITNLRDVGSHVNAQNHTNAPNSLGFPGVKACTGKFIARVSVDGSSHYVGRFPTPELAHAAYIKAKRVLHPGFAG